MSAIPYRSKQIDFSDITEFKPMLDKLEGAGVRLTAIELDCEINTAGFDGDIASPGSRRLLGLADLNNPNDNEAKTIAAGYRAYLKVMATLKDMRDHSKLTTHTPIISAGLAAVGPPSPKTQNWNSGLAVSLSDTIEFLRQNGMDKLVEGYGVHVYPDGDPHKSAESRITSLDQLFCRMYPSQAVLADRMRHRQRRPILPLNDSGRKQAIASLRTLSSTS